MKNNTYITYEVTGLRADFKQTNHVG